MRVIIVYCWGPIKHQKDEIEYWKERKNMKCKKRNHIRIQLGVIRKN